MQVDADFPFSMFCCRIFIGFSQYNQYDQLGDFHIILRIEKKLTTSPKQIHPSR